MPSLDPFALRAIGIRDEPETAMKNIFSLGELLHEEMGKADIFNSIACGEVRWPVWSFNFLLISQDYTELIQ